MQINREVVITELDKFIGTIFRLPEVTCAKIRDVSIYKNESRDAKLQEAMGTKRKLLI